ncbi:MAG: hypothetical protein HYR85_15770 [Planctomycetes bacterium]|nr:hypothetical protein [Planctomycetota bacterium]MBI3848111.1 hypothetical protein [Planctomycetota bacterium]
MRSFAIVVLCIVVAIVYGVAHDQVTARVCVEYFTIGHPAIFGTDDPTLLGIGWGIAATWWVGLLLGVPLAWAARAGDFPKRRVRSLLRPIAWLVVVMTACALVAGIVGFVLATSGAVSLGGPLGRAVAPEKHVAFIVDLWAHSASYFVGFTGGLIIVVQVRRSRSRRKDSATVEPSTSHEVATTRSTRGPVCVSVALLLTLWAVITDNITLTTGRYTAVLIQAVVCSSASLLCLAFGWPRMSTLLRVLSVILALADAWTLFDAGGCRLPGVLGL